MEAVLTPADHLKEEGIEHFNVRDYEAAARAFKQALDMYSSDGRDDMVAEMKVNLGLIHRTMGESQQAIELMEDALSTFERIEDKNRTAQVLGNLGGVYKSVNDQYQAELSYRQSANLFRELGEFELYVDTLLALGRLQWRSGKIFLASVTYQDALVYIDKEDRSAFHHVINMLSGILTRVGRMNNMVEKAPR